MKPQVRAFRDAAAQVCQLRQFSFRALMEDHGLEAILDDAEKNDWPAKEIAGQVLLQCCTANGKFNNFHIGLLAVMAFLNSHLGSLGQGTQQAFQDLASILKRQATLQALMGWLNTHYS